MNFKDDLLLNSFPKKQSLVFVNIKHIFSDSHKLCDSVMSGKV